METLQELPARGSCNWNVFYGFVKNLPAGISTQQCAVSKQSSFRAAGSTIVAAANARLTRYVHEAREKIRFADETIAAKQKERFPHALVRWRESVLQAKAQPKDPCRRIAHR